MSTHVSGIIDAPAANRSHTEPPETVTAPQVAPNTDTTVSVGSYANTGNVPQTVTVDVSNPVGCTITGFEFQDSQLQSLGTTTTINPTKSVPLKVYIHTNAVPPGDDVPYSFDVTSTWS